MSITFIKRTIDDIDNTADNRRGRVSYPIIKGFMETGYQVGEVDLTEANRKPQTLQVLLKSYVDTHRLPIKVIMRRNRLYLMRLDIDEEGNPIEDWQQRLREEMLHTVGEVEEITSAIVDQE